MEQGDLLSPLLFSLAVHASLRHANASLRPGEYMFAFLDDVYTVTSRRRAAEVARMVAASIHDHAGVEPELGKFQIWGRGGGPEPPGIALLCHWTVCQGVMFKCGMFKLLAKS